MGLLGGSGVVISRVISPLIEVISIVTLLITLLITSHDPPSMSIFFETPGASLTRETRLGFEGR